LDAFKSTTFECIKNYTVLVTGIQLSHLCLVSHLSIFEPIDAIYYTLGRTHTHTHLNTQIYRRCAIVYIEHTITNFHKPHKWSVGDFSIRYYGTHKLVLVSFFHTKHIKMPSPLQPSTGMKIQTTHTYSSASAYK